MKGQRPFRVEDLSVPNGLKACTVACMFFYNVKFIRYTADFCSGGLATSTRVLTNGKRGGEKGLGGDNKVPS